MLLKHKKFSFVFKNVIFIYGKIKGMSLVLKWTEMNFNKFGTRSPWLWISTSSSWLISCPTSSTTSTICPQSTSGKSLRKMNDFVRYSIFFPDLQTTRRRLQWKKTKNKHSGQLCAGLHWFRDRLCPNLSFIEFFKTIFNLMLNCVSVSL